VCKYRIRVFCGTGAALTGGSSFTRRLAVSGAGIALVASWVAGMAYVYSAGPSLRQSPSLMSHSLFVPKAMAHVGPLDARGQTVLLAASSVANAHGGARALVARSAAQDCSPACDRLPASIHDGNTTRATAGRIAAAEQPSRTTIDVRFDTVAAAAALSPQKLASLFARSDAPQASAPDAAAERFAIRTGMIAQPSADRFGTPHDTAPASYILALAVPDIAPPAAGDLLALAEPADEAAADPFSLSLPSQDSIPLPDRRPATAKRTAPAAAESPVAAPGRKQGDARKPKAVVAKKPETVVARRSISQRADAVELAYAPADDGAGSAGKAFKNLFNTGPGVVGGKRVAVYNISAKTVTMPDGEVLQAFSGIGEMANNPKYVGVKMRGPTPPDTYKLRMRETRFHGVEAIRMLPVDGKTKHGRDGFLAHTELLRGKKGQSHGCVAFRDYDRFLNAFKKGKVTHMVVIPGNGRGKPDTTKVASSANSRT
jgi:hypothetical protein